MSIHCLPWMELSRHLRIVTHFKNLVPLNQVPLILCSAILSACGSDSANITGDPQISQVPEALISYADTTAVVEAFNQDRNLEFELLRTTFHCYYPELEKAEGGLDLSNPHASLTFNVDNTFNLVGIYPGYADASGTFIDDPNHSSIELFSAEFGVFEGNIEFDMFGQSVIAETLGCYQQGASNDRAVHQFTLNLPEAADYSCKVWENDRLVAEGEPLTILSNNQYRYANQDGFFLLENVFSERKSTINLTSGTLSRWSGSYQENANNGVQNFVFTNGVDSDMRCERQRQRQPRPFKRYGAVTINPPPASSVPLTGVYLLDNGDDRSVGWGEFTADGFFTTELSTPGGTNCRRTRPNGLQPCSSYQYNGSQMTLLNGSLGGTFPLRLNDDGSFLLLDAGFYRPVITPSIADLTNGQWTIEGSAPQDYLDISMCVLGFCTSSHSSRSYQFFDNGRFTFNLISSGTSTVNTPNVSVNSSNYSADNSTGT